MERFLRFYIKFQGYTIGLASILGALFMTVSIYKYKDFHFPLEEFYNYRFMGSFALIFGAAWLAAGSLLIYGIFTESQPCLRPFVVLFMLDLFLIVVRDAAIILLNLPWHNTVLLNLVGPPMVSTTSFYLMFSLIALGKLFAHERTIKPDQTEFVVVFSEEEIQQAPLAQQEVVGDDIALVEE